MPAMRRRPSLRQQEESAVRAVHVEPEPLARGELRERREIVDRAGVRGAGVADDEEGRPAGGAVRRDRSRERVGTRIR